MKPIVKLFFYSFLIAPFYAYWITQELQLIPYYVLGSIALILFLFLLTQQKIHVPFYIYPLFLFAIYYSVWDFFNGRFEQFGIIKLLFKNYPLHILAVLLIIENIKFDKIFINNLLNGFKILVVISLIFTFIQVIFNPLFFNTVQTSFIEFAETSYKIRNTSIWSYLSPLDVGLSFLPILAILVGYYFYNRKLFQAFIFITMGGIVAVFTNSRWSILNLVLIIFPMLFSIRKKRIKTTFITIFSIFIIGFTINNFFNFLGFDFTTYLEGRILSKSSLSRILAIELFKEFFPKSPIFGTGIRVDLELSRALAGKSSQIHIGYLSSLYEFGIVGSVFLFSFWLLLLRTLYRNAKIHKQNFLMFGFACFLFANLTLVEYSIFHIGILLLIIFDRYYLSITTSNFEHTKHIKT